MHGGGGDEQRSQLRQQPAADARTGRSRVKDSLHTNDPYRFFSSLVFATVAHSALTAWQGNEKKMAEKGGFVAGVDFAVDRGGL